MTEKDFTNRIDGLINDYEGGESTSEEFRSGILDALIELVSKVSPFEAPVSPTERNSFGQWTLCSDKMPKEINDLQIGLDKKWIVTDGTDVWVEPTHPVWWDDKNIIKWMPLPKL